MTFNFQLKNLSMFLVNVFLFLLPQFFLRNKILLFGVILFSFTPSQIYKLFPNSDTMSASLIILSILLFLFTSILPPSEDKPIFFLNFTLLVSVILFFITSQFFLFYFLFEVSLLPILALILGWGYQIERIQSSFFMFMYMVIFSFPFFFILNWSFSNHFCFLTLNLLNSQIPPISLLLILGVFLVKSPIYLAHFWLPKAHVEASVIGSMILAGILLKMGGFGVYRFSSLVTQLALNSAFSLIFLMNLFVLIFCFLQSDFKSMIAYSSVAHMTLSVFAMSSTSIWGLKGGLMMMIAHGIVSPLMFFFMNSLYYFTHSRIFYMNQFSLQTSFLISSLIFWTMVLNINFPFFLSFLSEIFMMFSLFFMEKKILVLLVWLSLVGCYFSIFMLSNMNYGKKKIFFSKHQPRFKHLILSSFFFVIFLFFTLISSMF